MPVRFAESVEQGAKGLGAKKERLLAPEGLELVAKFLEQEHVLAHFMFIGQVQCVRLLPGIL